MNKYIKTCEGCRSQYTPKDHPERSRFCSIRCAMQHFGKIRAAKHLKTIPKFRCKVCRKNFVPADLGHRHRNPPQFCSLACRDVAQTKRVELKCDQCGEKFLRKNYLIGWSGFRGVFCS